MTSPTIDVVMPDGTKTPADVLHRSQRGLYAVVKLAGTPRSSA